MPRLSVFRSGKHIYAQIIDLDKKGKVLLSLSDIKLRDSKGNKTEKASQTGKSLAQQALKLGIKKVVFDRSGHSFAGRLAALARTAREGGLKF